VKLLWKMSIGIISHLRMLLKTTSNTPIFLQNKTAYIEGCPRLGHCLLEKTSRNHNKTLVIPSNNSKSNTPFKRANMINNAMRHSFNFSHHIKVKLMWRNLLKIDFSFWECVLCRALFEHDSSHVHHLEDTEKIQRLL
jgi:hypothetical protein